MKHWNLPLTYQPKIEPVRTGLCTQSIRVCTISKSKKYPGQIIRKNIGDLVRFYIWTGRPYWSPQKYITGYMELVDVKNCLIRKNGLDWLTLHGETGLWEWYELDRLAELDFIDPPTGEALRDVLISKNGNIPSEGIEAQILRWRF